MLAAPFDLPGDRRGILCVHGFTGTPFEMRHLGGRLHERGFTVVGPTLAGHGTSPSDLDRTTWIDWFDSVLVAFDGLRARCDSVAVVGQSLGGLLALHLARERAGAVAAVVALATPLWLPRAARLVLRMVEPALRRGLRLPMLPKLGGSDIRDRAVGRDNPAYDRMPLGALAELDRFTRVVRADLPKVTTPTLILHARHDHTASFECAGVLRRELGARHVELIALDRSYHLVSIDVERERVATETARFLDRSLAREV